ncbi:DUF350 domain-containing protein [Goodfellowiella coeruleoviolacea]|uniref:DUF350 domain-containing protein n=1 Tax=Goodfellowiella coeruleoviolacea TaxID=334858 RepID=UPI0020A33A01|nr:DUF350 domain-containing protein [Goodfellowiella coeruleoviolacea]
MTLALDPGFGGVLGRGIGAIVLYAIVGLALMLVGFYAIDWTTPGKLSALVRSGAPNAVVVTSAGLVSMALIVVIAIVNSSGQLDEGLLSALVFGLVGIIVQVIAVRVAEWVTRINIGEIIQSERFAPASAVVAAAHLALGLVVAAAIS